MSTSAPIPIIQNGLVFCYDTYNVKSYKGQPTTNYAVSPLDLYAWTSSANAATLTRDTSTSLSPVGGIPLKMVTTGTDPYTNTYSSSPWNLAAASSGQTWTYSIWVKANRTMAVSLFLFQADNTGNYLTHNVTGFTATTEWQRISITATLGNASTNYVQVRMDGPDTYTAGDIVWWDGLQLEQKSYATQFVAGTRSNTDSLLDLNRTATFNLSGTSFDTGANITFTATSNISLGPVSTYLPTTAITVNTWVRPNVVNSGYKKIFGTYTAGTATIQGIYFSIGPSPYNTYFGLVTTGGSNFATYAQDISTTKHTNLCGTYDGAIIKLYANGVLVATQAHTGTIGNGGIGRISGYDNNQEIWDGNIDVVSMYNRALTQSEILQNYNSTKSRFGL